MFTGIIEKISDIKDIRRHGSEYGLKIKNPFGNEIAVGDSISVDGICLTVADFDSEHLNFFVSRVTAEKSIIKNYEKGTLVNLERAMKLNGRFDGHIVQGHVDTIGTIQSVRQTGEGIEITVLFDRKFSGLITYSGSVSVNGISLTTAEISMNSFMVSLIPETLERTSFSKKLLKNHSVNIEFDIIGKYIKRLSEVSTEEQNLETLLVKL